MDVSSDVPSDVGRRSAVEAIGSYRGMPADCTICLGSEGPPWPIQCGCACRGLQGLAHPQCKVQAATFSEADTGGGSWCVLKLPPVLPFRRPLFPASVKCISAGEG
jgi:hypothetical protein